MHPKHIYAHKHKLYCFIRLIANSWAWELVVLMVGQGPAKRRGMAERFPWHYCTFLITFSHIKSGQDSLTKTWLIFLCSSFDSDLRLTWTTTAMWSLPTFHQTKENSTNYMQLWAGLRQWWEHWPSTNAALVDAICGLTCWFPTLLREVFFPEYSSSRFSWKTNIFMIPVDFILKRSLPSWLDKISLLLLLLLLLLSSLL